MRSACGSKGFTLPIQEIVMTDTPDSFRIVVDYGLTLDAMIMAGQYEFWSERITPQAFPITGEGKQGLTAQLIHFNRRISTRDVLKELDKMGLRAGRIEELLAFGATFPEIQRKFFVIALGSVASPPGSTALPVSSWKTTCAASN
jgi:hypothetical protein